MYYPETKGLGISFSLRISHACHRRGRKARMSHLVEINNLSYRYPDGTPALENISLTLAAGESLGIIGPNGAGKSTLLLHLNGILQGSGFIKIDGHIINGKNTFLIRRLVGLVFQNPDHQLFMPTVFEDVAFGPANMGLAKEEITKVVNSSLREVDMVAAKHRSSHHLSFGEKKRIALATVLAMDPKILALDEPSANLDPKHRWELIDLLKQMPVTKIIAGHDLELVKTLCDHIAILNRGKLNAFEKTTVIIGDKKLLSANDLIRPST